MDDKENCPDLVRALRSKDESAQGLQQQLELERKQRHEERTKNLAERTALQQSFQQQEAELQGRLQSLEAELEHRSDQQRSRASRMEEQLESARHREADLLERNTVMAADLRSLIIRAEADAAEILALKAKVDALSAELKEAECSLHTSDDVRSGLLREVKERDLSLEALRSELKELHLVERSAREHSQVQHERLSAQCESLTRQANERAKEADVFQERSRRLEEQLKSQELEAERSRKEADARRKDIEANLVKSREEVTSLKDELQARGIVESKLKETIVSFEAQVQDHKNEETRLRQELFRLQSVADERELSIQSGNRREQQLIEQVSVVEKRLAGVVAESEIRQTSLGAARSQLQTLEIDLQGAKEALAASKSELVRVRALEEEARQEVIRRSQQKADEAVHHSQELAENAARRAGEKIAIRDKEVQELEAEIVQRREGTSRLEAELEATAIQKKSLQKALADAKEEASNLSEELRRASEEARKTLKEQSKSLEEAQQKLAEQERRFTEERQLAEEQRIREEGQRQQALQAQKTLLVAEKEVMTSPRFACPEPSEGERIGAEVAALSRSVASLQSALNYRVGREEDDPDGHRSSGEGLGPRHPPGSRWRMLQGSGKSMHGRDDDIPLDTHPQRGDESSDGSSSLQELPLPLHDLPATSSKVHSRLPSKQSVSPEEIRNEGQQDIVPSRLVARLQIEESALALIDLRLAACERRLILAEVWRLWSTPAKLQAERARLELVLQDELRLAAEVRAREHSKDQNQPDASLLDELSLSTLKKLLIEFRYRLAEALAEAPGASTAVSCSADASLQAFMGTLELGRSGFGRWLHAALFLYQKLRTLVPSELELAMRDPVSKLVPVPFYVLPYKVRLAVKRGTVALARGDGSKSPQPGRQLLRRAPAGAKEQLEELEDRLPLCASDPAAVPSFLASLLCIRSQALLGQSAPPGFRDGLDVLAADALTVYMSGWRRTEHCRGALPGPLERSTIRKSKLPGRIIA
eukprot:TRINITY_DN26658_c0_g1_i1.p1 TRINITY_DN26658_c0_g1~~TRINITY_DN26658_c0_g1_i1.p1  ORF type:complete len:998 (-),score=257.45 TRINITY_DN26658_c0_g1_i1:55-3048(-)